MYKKKDARSWERPATDDENQDGREVTEIQLFNLGPFHHNFPLLKFTSSGHDGNPRPMDLSLSFKQSFVQPVYGGSVTQNILCIRFFDFNKIIVNV